MSAAISVLASDAPSAAIALYGTFDGTNLAFLARHLDALEGDVLIDCTMASSITNEAIALLHEYRSGAARIRRTVVIREPGAAPQLTPAR